MVDCNCAAECRELQYWGSLYSYLARLPSLLLTSVVHAQQLLAHGASAGAQTIYQAVARISSVVFYAIVSIWWFVTANAATGVFVVALCIAWQVFYPLRVTLRLLARLPYFHGIACEFPPLQGSDRWAKHVALTLNCGPSPYSTDTILALLGQHNAHATFFITGSQVEKCDAIGVGNGHEDMGKTILGRILSQGHQLGVQGWQNSPTHALSTGQLVQELTNCSKLLSTAQRYSVLLATADTSSESTTSAAPPQTPKRYKWFRPQGGLPNPSIVEAAEKLGYTTVLASVFPWDNYSQWPLLNAYYVWSKVYSGAVIMLNDGRHLLPTLKLILPWLKASGYQIVTLDTAAAASSPLQGELTTDVLAEHNKAHSIGKSSSYGTIDVMARAASSGSLTRGLSGPGSATGSSPEKSPASPQDASAAIMDDEAARQQLKAVRRAEADKRAGINRQLASMSAAECRAAERKERERKEAEKRRARRAAEELKAQQRYAEHVRRKAEQHRLMEPERVAAVDAWRQHSQHHVDQGSDEIQPV